MFPSAAEADAAVGDNFCWLRCRRPTCWQMRNDDLTLFLILNHLFPVLFWGLKTSFTLDKTRLSISSKKISKLWKAESKVLSSSKSMFSRQQAISYRVRERPILTRLSSRIVLVLRLPNRPWWTTGNGNYLSHSFSSSIVPCGKKTTIFLVYICWSSYGW